MRDKSAITGFIAHVNGDGRKERRTIAMKYSDTSVMNKFSLCPISPSCHPDLHRCAAFSRDGERADGTSELLEVDE